MPLHIRFTGFMRDRSTVFQHISTFKELYTVLRVLLFIYFVWSYLRGNCVSTNILLNHLLTIFFVWMVLQIFFFFNFILSERKMCWFSLASDNKRHVRMRNVCHFLSFFLFIFYFIFGLVTSNKISPPTVSWRSKETWYCRLLSAS